MTVSETLTDDTVTPGPLPRVGVVCDFREEGWPSMELVADMLLTHLQRDYSKVINAAMIRPEMRMRFARQKPGSENQNSGNRGRKSWGWQLGPNGKAFNADRVLNRFWDYPRYVRRTRSQFDLFHVIDHSYGQLLHELPPERTIVTCHDLDTFQCLLHPADEPRSIFFKKMMRRTLSGFRKAALVTCVSQATRDELVGHQLVDPGRVVVISNGVHPSCSPDADTASDEQLRALIGDSENYIDILHVGSTIPRKRIDILLRVFARLHEEFPNARLLRVGGGFTGAQRALVEELQLGGSILELPRVDHHVLAAIYRYVALVLLPSEREGFGLPLVEAMACGTPVVASDLPVLREVGGEAAIFCETGNVEVWVESIAELLAERKMHPERWLARREAGFAQAAKFSWREYARRMVEIYRSVLNSGQAQVHQQGRSAKVA
jgi:glycosyltransferase involved in cell wall biosynthesis